MATPTSDSEEIQPGSSHVKDSMMETDDLPHASVHEAPQAVKLVSIPCLYCSTGLKDPYKLACGHMLCASCIKEATKDDQIICPFPNCKTNCTQDQIEAVATGVGAAQVPDTSDYMEKAMEDDLREDPPLNQGPYKNLSWFQDMTKLEEFRGVRPKRPHLPTDATTEDDFQMHMAMMHSLQDQRPLIYDGSKSEDDWKKPVALPFDLKLDDIINILCSKVGGEQDYIEGFYACNDRNKIIIDITEGSIGKVQSFLQKHFDKKTDKLDQIFEFVEQEEVSAPVVSTGAKIADVEQLPQELQQSITTNHADIRADQLNMRHSYGTVTCLAETRAPDSQIYALTTKHAFRGQPVQPSEVNTSIVSSIGGRLTVIGTSHKGYMGLIRRNDQTDEVTVPTEEQIQNVPRDQRNAAVDIAAVRISQEVVNRLDKNLLNDLRQISRLQDTQINGREVTKLGAASGDTVGYICHPIYYSNRRGLVVGNYIGIFPNAPNTIFAEQGDSGSLVWLVNNHPIGVVVESWPNYRYRNQRRNLVLAVRLDNCIDTLRNMDIPITKLMAYGAALPVDVPLGHMYGASAEQPLGP